jgi:hypothetical protein
MLWDVRRALGSGEAPIAGEGRSEKDASGCVASYPRGAELNPVESSLVRVCAAEEPRIWFKEVRSEWGISGARLGAGLERDVGFSMGNGAPAAALSGNWGAKCGL